MTTMCTCGHARSQHHVRNEGRRRICDYAGYACECAGYTRSKAEAPREPPQRESFATWYLFLAQSYEDVLHRRENPDEPITLNQFLAQIREHFDRK